MTHLAVLRAYDGRPPVGVTLFIEGEEESGSPTLTAAAARAPRRAGLRRHRDRRLGQPGGRRARRSPRACAGWSTCIVEVRCWSGRCTPASTAARSATRSPRSAARWPACTTSTARSPSPGWCTAAPSAPDLDEATFRSDAGLLDGVELLGSGTHPGARLAQARRSRCSGSTRRGWPRRPTCCSPGPGPMVSMRLAPGDDAAKAQHALAEHLEAQRAVGRAGHRDARAGHRRAVHARDHRRRLRRRPPRLRRRPTATRWWRPASAARSRSSPSSRARSPGAAVLVTGVGDPASRWHGIDESLRPGDVRPRRCSPRRCCSPSSPLHRDTANQPHSPVTLTACGSACSARMARPDPARAAPAPPAALLLRGLLARLALDAGRPVVHRARWSTTCGATRRRTDAGNALQALVSRLRRAIGAELVDTEPGGYRLRVEPDAVDALRFDVAGRRGRRADPRAGARLLGEALGALARTGAGRRRRAALRRTGRAHRLDERRARAVERGPGSRCSSATPRPSSTRSPRQLDAAPLRETTAALLARGLHAAGRQADALAVLDRTRARLADELGVDPGPELSRGPARRAARRRRSGAHGPSAAPAPAAAHQLRRPRRRRRADPRRCSRTAPAGHAHRAGRRRQDPAGPGGRRRPRRARPGSPSWPRSTAAGPAAGRGARRRRRAARLLRPPRTTAADTTARLLTALAGRELAARARQLRAPRRRRRRSSPRRCWPRARGCGCWPPAASRSACRARCCTPSTRSHGADAVRLFAERAAAVVPGSRSTPTSSPPSPRSAAASTASRCPSSWPRPGCAR